jgi:hypothetical protein
MNFGHSLIKQIEMKNKSRILINPLALMAVLLILSISCKKKADTPASATPKVIGQNYGGGIIFYVDVTGQHGLISASSDQSSGAEWGCYGTSIPGTNTAIGMGKANTTAIVNGCSTAGIAARICDDLVLNGYSDWFLPSRDELNQMYLQKTVIGGFANDTYYSSSEYDPNLVWVLYFPNGTQFSRNKNVSNFVRAVRAF